jgi:glutathione synthase
LADVDAIFIRKDPPFDTPYLYATLLLEHVRHKTLTLNDPRGLREANEKLYALNFQAHMPQTLVSSNEEQILEYVKEMGGRAVIKPLDLAGGSGVMILSTGDKNARAIAQLITAEGTRLAMVQEFLPDVVNGDKRILLLDGNVLGTINRVPRTDDFRSNIHVGGNVEPYQLTAKEHEMVASIAPRLRADGLMFVGLDMIGGKLTEVNVTSPTGIQQLSRHEGRDIAEDVIAWVEQRAKTFPASRQSLDEV